MKKKVNLFWNLIIIFSSSLILLIPLIIYAINFNLNKWSYELNQPGFLRVSNLPIVITLTIVCTLLACWYWYYEFKHIKYIASNTLQMKHFKLFCGFLILDVLGIIFFVVSFFAIWLYAFNDGDIQKIPEFNKLRLNTYIITYCVLTTILMFINIFLSFKFHKVIKINYLKNDNKDNN